MKQLVKIDAQGRILLTQKILDLLAAYPGDEVTLWIEDGMECLVIRKAGEEERQVSGH